MGEFQFEFNLDGFNKLFPFYLLIDKDLTIKKIGDSLHKLMPFIKENSSFTEVFRAKRPNHDKIDGNTLKSLCSQLVIIESLEKTPVVLRGQFQNYNDLFLFVGSPWFVTMNEMKEKNLKSNDFAIHDPLVDFLHMLKKQENSNEDLKELIIKIEEQKQILIQDKE
jgi:hypothetical protein